MLVVYTIMVVVIIIIIVRQVSDLEMAELAEMVNMVAVADLVVAQVDMAVLVAAVDNMETGYYKAIMQVQVKELVNL